ncbi:DUF1772 domain-containing protein [Metabacillus herbersteinensis]|uniref:DUF1772 domain-containing protein n=1 Tax=Metabacillus herbersteinensis TaxID=283816 RepID=A0ABV6G9R1_9BACI
MMVEKVRLVIIILINIGIGLNAGLFFVFSTCIMTALSNIRSDKGISAMQAINIYMLNPFFAIVFGGTAFLCIILIVIELFYWNGLSSILILLGSSLFLIGTISVTMLFNVPLNDSLAKVRTDTSQSTIVWSNYLIQWTKWNHVRTIAALFSMLCFILGTLQLYK